MKNLYIGNLPEEISDEELQTVLCKKADIQRVGIFKDRYTERSLGFGFITVDERSEQDVKMKLTGFDIKGRKIVLN